MIHCGRLGQDGVKVETVKSIPLYSVINGFWINETGNLEIVIRYKPQDWFETGLMISSLTFIACIGTSSLTGGKAEEIDGLKGWKEKLKI